MAYDAHKRNVIGTLCFFALGVLIGGFAAMIAVWREWLQYKRSGVLEIGDFWRYFIASSAGAVVQFAVLLIVILVKM